MTASARAERAVSTRTQRWAGRHWPTPFDWEVQRHRISSLYKHYTLPQVQHIMAQEYNFHATCRMYRGRLSAWGQDKNHKEHEMRVIAREAHRQRSEGQQAIFFVRGKEVTYESVQRYYKRRRTAIETVVAESTPHDEPKVDLVQVGELPAPAAPTRPETPTTSQQGWPMLAESSSLARTLSTPHAYAIPEQAIHAVKAYIRGSFDAHSWWSTTETEHFQVRRITKRTTVCALYDCMNKLHCQVRLACDLFTEQRFQEGGLFLRSSMDGIKEIVESAYPPLPTFLPRTLHSIVSRGAPEVAFAVTRQFAKFAKIYHGRSHPIYQICKLFDSIDPDMLDGAICCMVAAASDAFATTLGRLHRTTLGSRWGFLLTMLRSEGPAALIQGLRQIIQECMVELPPGDVRTTVFRLHLARWLLKARPSLEDRIEAEEIIEEIKAESMAAEFDKEAGVLLVQAQIAAAENESAICREEAMDRQLRLAMNCLGCSCLNEHGCVVGKLFWPSENLWEGKATLFGERDGPLLRHFAGVRGLGSGLTA